MDDKLNRFFNKIGYTNLEDFKDSNVEKVTINKLEESWTVYIKNKKFINIDSMINLINLCSKGIDDVKTINIVFSNEIITNDDIITSFRYLLNDLIKESPSLSSIINNEITIIDDVITIEVISEIEEKLIKKETKKLIKKLEMFGLYDLNINCKINEKLKEEIKKKIKETRVEIVKTEEVSPIILGEAIKGKVSTIDSIVGEDNNIVVEAFVFGLDIFESSKSNFKILTLKISDKTDSILAKVFSKDEDEFKNICKSIKSGNWYKIRGYIKNDQFAHDMVLNIRDMENIPSKDVSIIDDAEEKRIELHAHTFMSQMDGCVDAKKLLKTATKWGHKAIGITDHNGCQSFPDVYHFVTDYNKGKSEEDKFKAIYGSEMVLVDDTVRIVTRPNELSIMDTTYCVFDIETTGFNAGGQDSIIEIGAVLIRNGEIIDRFDELIDPKRPLPYKIIELTNITDDMLKGKDDEETVVKRFMEWAKDYPLVAHNAKFDTSFIDMCHKKYNMGEFTHCVIDTLELSRALEPEYNKHSLSALVKRYDVPWDEDAHHRADYDAEGTALVLTKMLKKLQSKKFEKISEINNLIDSKEIHKYGRTFHVNLLVQNKIGLKNLFKIISYANTTYLYKTPRILRSKLEELREGILIGSGCYESEVFIEARSKSEEELRNIIDFYDYVEIQPKDAYSHLIDQSDFLNEAELESSIRKIINCTKEQGKIIVATGDVHYLNKEDKIYREIIINQKVPGGGRHTLNRPSITHIPENHFRTTNEMLDDFSYLGSELAYEMVVLNPKKISDSVEIIEVIIETGGVPFSPKMGDSRGEVYKLVYDKAHSMYGNPLPNNIESRIAQELYGDGILALVKNKVKSENEDKSDEEIENIFYTELSNIVKEGYDKVFELTKENIKNTSDSELTLEELDKQTKKNLGGIIGGGFDVIYLIAQKLVKHSNDDGYLVGSRGSVGSSFVATMMGITEVNPLPAHYLCPNCKMSIFNFEDGRSLGSVYSSGFDLPDKNCPNCGTPFEKDGQDMPFATFLGFNADKVPDIDLNFSGDNQASAHEYTKVLFGVDNVYRAGTIGTVAEKTAYGFVKGYCEEKGINLRSVEIERLAMGCTGIKRTTGQHPGGIVVIPGYMDVFDFTPFQYPADDPESAWRTTHFDYHAIDQDVLKLDILGHDDPTVLRMLQDLSGMDVTKVPLDDKDTMAIFKSPEPLGVTSERIMCETGTLGIPEFGTKFTIGMLMDTKPSTFSELIKISGLSHGTDVWLGNAQELIRNNVVEFKDVIGCRDDIMVYLMYRGLAPKKAFKIMEFVRKGKASKDPEAWMEYDKEMREAGIEDWFIDSCRKIKYMFPKAHAAAYVISAFRIAYFKVHHPLLYYAAYFSIRCDDFDVDSMIKGETAIRAKIEELQNKGFEISNKEANTLDVLLLALEMTARGFSFKNIDLEKSDSRYFLIDEDKNSLIIPFRALDGMGVQASQQIVVEREKGKYISIEDLQNRGKVNTTSIERLRSLGVLKGLPESSQLSLF
ncbi:MAG: PolC-type DNA polymerase III [Bacilli bacterium]|nr:PolC-type DNA polymerase III [Bacilli bacterium]